MAFIKNLYSSLIYIVTISSPAPKSCDGTFNDSQI